MSETNDKKKLTWKQKRAVLWRFVKLIWEANPRLFLMRAFVVTGLAAFSALQVYFFARLINAITAGSNQDAVMLVIAALVTYGSARLFDGLQRSGLEDWFSRNISSFTQEVVLRHLSQIDPARLQDERIRRDMDFVRSEMWRLNNLPGRIEQIARSATSIFTALSLATLAPWWVLALVVMDSIIQAIKSSYESSRDLWTATWNSLDGRRVEYVNYTFMTSDELRELRLLGASAHFLKTFHDASARILKRFRDLALRSTAFALAGLIFHVGAYSLVIWTFGFGAFRESALLATLYISINLFQLFGDALNLGSSAWSKINSDLGVLARIDDLLNFPVEPATGSAIPKEPLIIEFKDVSFQYRHAEKPALSHVTVTLSEREHLAVVGENGAGKSTFLRLLSGLDKPTSGQILVNGKPLESFKREEWRRAFHLMLQGAKIYQDAIEENLQYGAPTKSWRPFSLPMNPSLMVSGADTVIAELPKGIRTYIGDWAVPPGEDPFQVSGGQQQRLLIARTLMHGGRIIGFDEPTSAMDAIAETNFFERLHKQMQDRGLIYISHRFSTVRRASRILVFEHGKLVQDGTHEELAHTPGTYANLYQEQAKWYTKSA